MGDFNLQVNVDRGKPSPGSRFSDAMQSGFSDGLAESLDYLQDLGVEHARDIVMGNDRVWNGQVKRGFDTTTSSFPRWYHKKGKILNKAPHAMIVEKGLAPAGEITGSTPSVEDILPWVDSEITPNAAARASADAADLDNWDPEWRMLAEQYGTADVIAAFAIATHIRDKGYPGLRFMETTESTLQSQEMNVKNKVEKHLRRELRKKGLQ